MQLISPLVGGIAGAENGYATLRRRGTAAVATWYGGFGGTVPSTANVTLDEHGGADNVYVNESVDVKAYDSTGTLVRQFTQMAADSDTEVISSGFTGIDYVTGASATSKPTTLQDVLNLWFTKNNAPDWLVKVGSTTATLPTWLGGLSGIFYNVKSATYGAKGTGTDDDTSAVQAAITAAHNASGGIVFFPKGTYRLTSALTCYADVWLWGVGAMNSVLRIDDAAAGVLSYATAGGTGPCVSISGLTVDAAQANLGTHIAITNTTNLFVQNCVIGNALTQGAGISCSGTVIASIDVDTCRFYLGGATALCATVTSSNAKLNIRNSTLYAPATLNAPLLAVRNARIRSCKFDFSATTAGTCWAVDAVSNNGRVLSVNDCTFTATGGGTATGILIADADGTHTMQFAESGNVFLCNTGVAAATSVLSNYAGGVFHLTNRDSRTEHLDRSADVDPTLNPLTYGSSYIHATHNSDCAVTLPGPHFPGQRYTLFYYNATGAPRTLDTNVVGATTTAGIADSITEEIPCIAMNSGSGLSWVLFGAKVALS